MSPLVPVFATISANNWCYFILLYGVSTFQLSRQRHKSNGNEQQLPKVTTFCRKIGRIFQISEDFSEEPEGCHVKVEDKVNRNKTLWY